jgi:hypothetical protein
MENVAASQKTNGGGMDLKIRVEGVDAIKAALRDIGAKAPRALTLTLNKLADDGQKAVQDRLSSGFTLRRPDFVKRTIYRSGTDFATNSRPQARFGVNPARDQLAKFEENSVKAPISGRNVAIPLSAVKPTNATVVPKRLRPAALRASEQVRKVTTANGTFLVKNVQGKGVGRRVGWRTDFLYKLVPNVRLTARLRFHETAKKAIDESFVRTATAGIEAALAGFTGRKL